MTNEIAKLTECEDIKTIETDGSSVDLYIGLSTLEITEEQQAILLKKVSPDMIEIKPTGEIYLGHVFYRRILNEAFGIGKWALKPLGNFVKPSASLVCREYGLYINGQFAASAIGEQEYVANNSMMTWSDACEATKSNAIMRCCKDLGVGLECWDKRFIENFKREYCVKVYRKKQTRNPWQWRRKDADPFYDEGDQAVPENHKPEVSTPQSKNNQEKGIGDHEKAKRVITGVSDITQKQGVNSKTKKPYTIYKIIGDSGVSYSTFDENLATLARSGRDAGLKIEIEYETDKYGNNIKAIRLVEPGQDEAIATVVESGMEDVLDLDIQA